MPTTLYRFFDADGRLLYVGITALGPQRWTGHASREWWPRVARIATAHFEDRAAAIAAEITAIQSERPLHNVVHAHAPTPAKARIYRRHGEGSIVQRSSDGRWQVAVTDAGRRRYWTTPDEAGARLILACLQGLTALRSSKRKAIAILEGYVERR